MTYSPKPKEWFMKRIGKRIYADNSDCCDYCRVVSEEGLIVKDEEDAESLAEKDADFYCSGTYLNYRDKK